VSTALVLQSVPIKFSLCIHCAVPNLESTRAEKAVLLESKLTAQAKAKAKAQSKSEES